ncbi:MAG: hypothetical protein QGG54_05020 [Gammaproteobacteria bacterium]|nr:hypothetical protein [Gammaproteobacteria bacterium]
MSNEDNMNSDVIASSETRARKLSAEEIAEIEHEMTLYPDKQAVGLEALKIVPVNVAALQL